MDAVTVSIILDTRRALKDGTYPVKLRLTYQRKQKYYPTVFTSTESDFAKVYSIRPRKEHQKLRRQYNALEEKANEIIDKMPVFSFEKFERKFYDTAVSDDVFSVFDHQIKKLKTAGRVGDASSYECAYLSILRFVNKLSPSRYKGLTRQEIAAKKEELLSKRKPLSFAAVTVEFLQEYERWMLQAGLSLTTVGIYLRALRAVFNEGIATYEVNATLYPFGKRKFQIPAGRNPKKALLLTDVEKIFNYVPVHDGEAKARDLWLFSYLCNGINVKDMARLKYRNIEEDKITFVRAKTERTTRQSRKSIVAIITPEVERIIQRWGNTPAMPDAYVFPILQEGLSAEQELAKVRQATKFINQYIKRIAAAVGIEKNISTYVARHTYSTILKRAGAPIEVISEALGHQDVQTTESYLDSFEDDVKRHYANQLTAFPATPTLEKKEP
ncbi:tyrosine-type recombinase/integrase [Pontibacter sp. H259]|uniref:tyrosine-type recombinase/integrase n=1 Tax=Pontibacter sp. H259 TaxID=3133421 RepID=UPI0030BCE40C